MVKLGYVTTAEAARRLGLSARAVRLLAGRRGHGRTVLGRLCFTEAEVRDMRDRGPGPSRAIDKRR